MYLSLCVKMTEKINVPIFRKGQWLTIALFSLLVVACLGLTLRSKFIFDLPFIDYVRLLEAHSHFAFAGWVTLALMALMVHYILPPSAFDSGYYPLVFAGVVISAFGMLCSLPFQNMLKLSQCFSLFFICCTYLFGVRFLFDLYRAKVKGAVRLLSVSAIAYLMVSSVGPLLLGYLFSVQSLNSIYYKNALFTYLHLQYNGFFSLGVFALFFQLIATQFSTISQRSMQRFSICICASVIPSLFITLIWPHPSLMYYLIAGTGSLLLVLTFVAFIWLLVTLYPVINFFVQPARVILYFSFCAFLLKTILQSLTIFKGIEAEVFGNRPVIMAFLHLVFLGFVSLFLISYLYQQGELLNQSRLSKWALIVFTIAVVANEVLLGLQGLGGILILSSALIPKLLWLASILLVLGASLLFLARLRVQYFSSQKSSQMH